MERSAEIIGIFILILSSLLVLSPQSGVTGAIFGVASSDGMVGNLLAFALFIIAVLVLLESPSLETRVDRMYRGPVPTDRHPYRFDDILSDNVPARAKKGLRHFGERLLRAYHGKKRFMELDSEERDRCAYELGKINLLMRAVHRGSVTSAEKEAFFRRFGIHALKGNSGLGDEVLSVEAPQFNRVLGYGGKGNLRYVFDPMTLKYEGLAKHPKGNIYDWAD